MNQRTLLLRNHSSLPAGVAADLAKEAKSAAQADSVDAVRGHEGQAAAIYLDIFPECSKALYRQNLMPTAGNAGRRPTQ